MAAAHTNEPGSDEPRFLRLPEVEFAVGKKRSAIYREVASGCFPGPYSLGGRSVGWLQSEINAWILSRPRVKLGGPHNNG